MLTFRYSISTRVLLVLGGLLGSALVAVLVLLVVAGVLGGKAKGDAIWPFVGIASMATLVALVLTRITTTWYAYVTTYLVDEEGIEVTFRSGTSKFAWAEIERASYRRLLGELEFRIRGIERPVVLTNVDMNSGRSTLLRALALADTRSAVAVVRRWV